MPIRRIVTGTDHAGRSCVVSDGSGSSSPGFDELWQSEGGDPLASVAAASGPPVRFEPAPGGTSWRVFDLPPDEVVAAYLKRACPKPRRAASIAPTRSTT